MIFLALYNWHEIIEKNWNFLNYDIACVDINSEINAELCTSKSADCEGL